MGMALRVNTPRINYVSTEEFDKRRDVIQMLTGMGGLASLTCLSVIVAYPVFAAGEQLTDLFRTATFQGTWEVVAQMQWLGWLMNRIISIFCVLGLWMIFYQRLISMLYLSSRNLFDNIYEVKKDMQNNSFFGLPHLVKNTFNATRASGADTFIYFGYGLLPNVKHYSDYDPERRQYGLTDDDNIMQYMLKTAPQTILLVFFFSMGWNGSLAKAYGTTAEAMATAADRLVSVNYSAYISKFFAGGDNYAFSIGNNNTQTGKFADNLSREIYGRVLSKMNIIDTQSRLIVGKNVENFVWTEILGGSYNQVKLQSLAQKSAGSAVASKNITVANDNDVAALSYAIEINNNSTLGAQSGVSANIKSKFLNGLNTTSASTIADNLQMHIIIRKDKVANVDFFVVPQADGK